MLTMLLKSSAMLCCPMLCCAVLRSMMLQHAVPCCAVQHYLQLSNQILHPAYVQVASSYQPCLPYDASLQIMQIGKMSNVAGGQLEGRQE